MSMYAKRWFFSAIGIAIFAILIFMSRHAAINASYGQLENNTFGEQTFSIFAIKDEELSEVKIENESGTITFIRTEIIEKNASGEETIKVVYEHPENKNAVLIQTKIKNMLYDFYDFYVKRLITEDMSSKEEYGFSETSPAATVKNINGEETKFILGAKIEDSNDYYVKMDGDDKIYLMSGQKANCFLDGLSVYRDPLIAQVDTNTLRSFSITDNWERIMGIRYKNENDAEVVTTDFTTYVMTHPYNGPVRIDPFSKLMSNFSDVIAVDFVEDNPQNLSKYGFDTPLKVVLQDIAANVHTLNFGGLDEKGNVYTRYNDLDLVFTTEPDMYNAVKNVEPYEFVGRFVNLYNMKDVSNITVTEGELVYSLDIGPKTEKGDTYKINGKEAIEGGFKTVYQSIIGLVFTGDAEEEKKDNEICTIEFKFRNGTSKKTVVYEYNDRNYGVLKSDGEYGITVRKNINNILEFLEELDESPDIKP